MPTSRQGRPPRDIVVIGGSVAAISALARVTAAFPLDFSAVVLVALQRPPGKLPAAQSLADLRSPLPTAYAVAGETVAAGRIYVSPPNKLMSVDARGAIALLDDPTGSSWDRAVDSLFLSAASVYGARVLGVVLSGSGKDGTEGMLAIHSAGGLGIVQSLAEAHQPGMPTSAILKDHPNEIALLDDIPKAILKATR